MFGLLIPDRPVDTTPVAITNTKCAFRIRPTAADVSHVVVFLLPGDQLPQDTAATVYIQTPPSQEFKLIGGIGPGKESAMFKVTGLKCSTVGNTTLGGYVDAMSDEPRLPSGCNGRAASGDIVIGLAIEPAAQVDAQVKQLIGAPCVAGNSQSALVRRQLQSGGMVNKTGLAQRIIGNAFNFMASFGKDEVPLKAFGEWWKKFERKVALNPSFLEEEGLGCEKEGIQATVT